MINFKYNNCEKCGCELNEETSATITQSHP